MYYDFFGFREPPFSIAPDPRYLYLSERHKEALAHLMYGVQGQGGFVVITGEVGTGKTTISRCFIENVPDHVDIALILNPRLSARELLASFCDELGIPYAENATIKQLIDRINQHLLEAHARGRHQVLMIDEAQNLSAEVLEQLRLLTNLETAEKKLLQIVLLGQPELKEMLDRPELRQLNQRVTARYHLDALEREELPAYLHYRLGVAGVKVELFSPATTRLLFRKSHGIPRLINLLSDRALLGAYSEGVQHIEPRHIRAAAKEVGGLASRPSPNAVPPVLRLVTVAAVVVALAVAAWAVVDQRQGAAIPEQLAAAGGAQGGDAVETLPGPGSEEGDPNDPVSTAGGDDSAEAQVASGTVERQQDAVNEAPELPAFDLEEHGLSTADAYAGLFRLWGFDWDRSAYPFACDYADAAGLRCMHRQGSRRSMEAINRPAVLDLRGPGGERTYVTLLRLKGDVATIATREGTLDVSFSDLEDYWYGQFSVLWQLPPYMAWGGDPSELPRNNREGVWLSARMMQLVGMHASDREEVDRVSRMIRNEQVRWYQKVKGLKQDGVVGAMTLIQMSNDLDAGVPRLVPSDAAMVAPVETGQATRPRSG
ncbi:ExeA family protein [Marinobacter segnicrescens]|uniref:General secretion pathway protein A n=1 Tax=Marinobacter segnicrescens TaxID=430453 RepID=A0A1I0CYX3_9GAMM|nr:AAA family ATPase [Marinobacter segnicrescens]SET24695.1 general secretion pathway protein A [Marinobacter segnicrescens]